MTPLPKDEVLRLAREAGFFFCDAGAAGWGVLHSVAMQYSQPCFERFASLCRAEVYEQGQRDMRDAAVKICYQNSQSTSGDEISSLPICELK